MVIGENMPRQIGLIYAWKTDGIDVIISQDEYRPGIGDILYTKLDNKYILLQVIGYEGNVPISTSSLVKDIGEPPPVYSLEKSKIVKTQLFFEIRSIDGNNPLVIKPYQPPPLGSPVYMLDPRDQESMDIMEMLSRGITGGEAVPVGWLRSGIAPAEQLKPEKYFRNAPLNLDLHSTVPKHILVSGQTGAGKTTSVMGLALRWALKGSRRIAWVIIDRHGEYSKTETGGFTDLLIKALELNDKLETRVRVFKFTINSGEVRSETRGGNAEIVVGTINISSINVYDIANVLDLPPDKVSDLEETVEILASLIKASNIDPQWKKVFIDANDEATGQILALIPLLVDNVFRYEGVGEIQKRGIYRVLLNAGIDIRKLRTYRRLLMSILGLTRRTQMISTGQTGRPVTLINDSTSVFKVSPLLKDPYSLVKIMEEMIRAATTMYHVNVTWSNYPWKGINGNPQIGRLEEGTVSIDKIIEYIDGGESIILDISKIPLSQGDTIVQSVIRRLFESRINLGVEDIKRKDPVAIVSEEAPLYLSPEKVRSPYNVFARIAREGRKFGLGLIAITQLATQIERQILANFNTIIALRTKFVSDINYLTSIGIPGTTLTRLGDREGYLYTPDLRVKEPIPIYIPGYFEHEEEIYNEYERRNRDHEERERKVLEYLSREPDDEGDDEI